MKKLLAKTRKINRLVQSSGRPVDFSKVAAVLSDVIEANIYVVNKEGKVLGYDLIDEFECDIMLEEVLKKDYFPRDYNDWLLGIHHTQSNYEQQGGKCVFKESKDCLFKNKLTTIIPLYGGGERLGTLIVARFNEKFEDADLLLAEYGATVIALEILRSESDRREKEARKKAAVQVAIDTLSYSELEAVEHILSELDGNEGSLVASKIADRVGITRSVIVNALRKFESAGVIESRSLGMKGTHIKILNEHLLDELNKLE